MFLKNKIKISFLFIALIIIFSSHLFGQWVNNPTQNTRIVVDGVKPINITSIEDLKGGAFVFWEDNKNGLENDILFSHIDGNGKVSFRADGKKVSELSGTKTNPVASSNLPNTAVVVWKDFTRNKNGNLFVQKVFGNGKILWRKEGVQVSNVFTEIYDYTITSDAIGDVYIPFMAKMDNAGTDYKLKYQKVTSNGTPVFDQDGIDVFSSPFRKFSSSVIPDYKGGAYIFWLENQNSKTTLYAQHVDTAGKALWGKKPLAISNIQQHVISYSVKITDYNSIYIAWQVQKLQEREIFHQLLSLQGRFLWGALGKLASNLKGNKTNPQVLTADSTIMLSWTNEVNDNKDVYIQKYSNKGIPKWKEDVAVTHFKYDQFGQKLLSDGKAGAIVSWIDKRKIAIRPNIYAQRVSASGKLLWDTSGVSIASHENTEKSYQSLVSDLRGGVINIFKEIRDGKGEIYAQKVFNTGTYIAQIIGLSSVALGDSIKISWYSANEASETVYDIEKSISNESGSSPWISVGSIKSTGVSTAKYYEFYDLSQDNGTIFYRVVQKDNSGNIQPSDAVRIELLSSKEKITVGQNSPNPFFNETLISFYLPEAGYVKVEFYNSRIEKIQETDSKYYLAGENKISFSGKGFLPGIYFYKFTCGDFVDVKKMIVAKK